VVWLQYQLECAKVKSIETGEPTNGTYVQSVNSLSGLLTKLGIDRADLEEPDLEEILQASEDE